MSVNARCANAQPHNFHEHEAVVEEVCPGLTRCGVLVHAPHTFTKQRALWCPGICDCWIGGELHGPGDHK